MHYGFDATHGGIVGVTVDIDVIGTTTSTSYAWKTCDRDTALTVEIPSRFFFYFSSGNVLDVLSATGLALTNFYDDVMNI